MKKVEYIIQEYVTRCNKCKDEKVAKIKILKSMNIYLLCGHKLKYKCIICNEEYCTIIEPYFEEEKQ